jgi:hypothetical protein
MSHTDSRARSRIWCCRAPAIFSYAVFSYAVMIYLPVESGLHCAVAGAASRWRSPRPPAPTARGVAVLVGGAAGTGRWCGPGWNQVWAGGRTVPIVSARLLRAMGGRRGRRTIGLISIAAYVPSAGLSPTVSATLQW